MEQFVIQWQMLMAGMGTIVIATVAWAVIAARR